MTSVSLTEHERRLLFSVVMSRCDDLERGLHVSATRMEDGRLKAEHLGRLERKRDALLTLAHRLER